MAEACWQHEITRFNVVAYAVGGKSARERVPGAGGLPAVDDDTSIGWENAHGRWNLGTYADGRSMPVRPRLSPEQDQIKKEMAISKLLGLSSKVARSGGRVEPAFSKGGAERSKKARTEAEQKQAGREEAVSTFESQLANAAEHFEGKD